MNRVIENFQAAFYPYEEVAIDEMVIGYKERMLRNHPNFILKRLVCVIVLQDTHIIY